jgi:sulfoxide reductase heme-binding subunit YedZ
VATSARALDRRYHYVYKPLLFALCLIPFLGCVGGILALSGIHVLPGYALGADPVRFVLDEFGKSALRMLLLTLAVTPLRHWTGNAQLLRLRRMLGLFTFFYALLHFSVYVGLFQSFSWSAIAQDIVKRPYITIGFAALLLLVPLAVTSTNGMMRRLRQRWQQLHRLIYLIAPLAVLHFWKMLKSDYREPLVYGAILALLLGARLWHRYRRSRTAAGAATSRSALPRAPERT